MGLPLVGAHAVLTGVPQFETEAGKVNSSVGNMQKNFVGLSTGAQGFGLTFGRAMGGIEAAALGAVAVVGKLGGSLLKDVYDAGPIANIEKVYHNMTTNFGIDSEKLMLDLRKASYGAVDDFELMQKANLSMIGSGKEFGKFFAESLPKLMKISRESAKAQGVDVDYAFNSITTGIKRMSPMILDNLGFQISLTEATDRYAASIGKTSKELSKEEKQMAVLNLVLSQGDDLINSTGGHMDNVQTTWIGWGTAISNARKRFAIELLPIMQKFMDLLGSPNGNMLSGKAVQLGKAITGIVLPALDKLFNVVSAVVNGPIAMLIQGVGNIGLGGLKDLAEGIVNVFSGSKIDTSSFQKAFTGLFSGLLGKDLAGQIAKQITAALSTIQTFLAPVRGIIDDIIVNVQNLITVLGQMVTDFAQGATASGGFDFFTGLANVFYGLAGINTNSILSKIGDVFLGISDAVSQVPAAFQQAQIIIQPIIQGISDTFNKLWAVAQPVINGLVELVSNYLVSAFQNAQLLFQNLQPTFQAVFDYLSGIFGTFINDVLPLLIQAFGGVVDWLNAHWPEIEAVVRTVIDAVSGVINWFATNVLPFIVDNFKQIVAWVQANWPLIQKTIETVLNAIWSVVQTVLNAIKQFWADHGAAITSIVTSVWGAIKTVVETVINLIEGIIKAVMQIINGDWDGAWQTIKTTVENVWNGIVAFISNIVNALVTLINEVLIKPVKSAWDNFWGGVAATVHLVWEGILSFLQTAVNGAIGIFNGMIDQFNMGLGQIVGQIPRMKEVAWTTHDELVAAAQDMSTKVYGATSDITKSVMTMKTGIAGASVGIADPIANSFGEARDKVAQQLNDIIDKVHDAIKNVSGIDIPMPHASTPGAPATSKPSTPSAPATTPKPSTCFLAGTAILMADGRQTPIELILAGQKVMSYDLHDNQLHTSVVQRVMHHTTFKYYFLRLSDETCLDVTGEHPMYTPNMTRPVAHDIAQFTLVRDLEIGDELWIYDPESDAPYHYKPVTLREKREEFGEEEVYNLQVSMYHTYLANMVLVHNKTLAQGAILGGPTYLAGEAGAEVVAPLSNLTAMIQQALTSVLAVYASSNARYYSPQAGVVNQRGGDTYYQLTMQSMARQGTTELEFRAMEMAHL